MIKIFGPPLFVAFHPIIAPLSESARNSGDEASLLVSVLVPLIMIFGIIFVMLSAPFLYKFMHWYQDKFDEWWENHGRKKS